jgi:hypothetical protein
MGVVIEFYIPRGFQKRQAWVPFALRGRVIQFQARTPWIALYPRALGKLS